MDNNVMDNNLADQQMRKCPNPACGILLDNLANFCPECGATAPSVYGGIAQVPAPAIVGAQSATVTVGAQSAPSTSSLMDSPGVAGMLEANPSGPRSRLAMIHTNIRYQMFMLMVCLINTATVIADLILEHTHSTVVAFSEDDEGSMGYYVVQLRYIFAMLFVMDAALGLVAWRAHYLRRNGMLHIIVAIIAVLSAGATEFIGLEQEHFNLWGITAVKLAGYIRIIKLLLRGGQSRRPTEDTPEAPV
jgi:uncharacterized membrane protein YhaH (DUF805 family)